MVSMDQGDPRYREGLAHLQAGEWQEAIRCFEALLSEQPDSTIVRQALEDARLKAAFDATTRVRAKRWIVPWRAIVFRLLVVVLIVLAVAVGYRLVDRQFAPAVAQAQALRHRQQLLVEGDAHLKANELDAAEASYTELLALVPDHAEAQQGLAQIKTARELDALYQRAVELQKAGKFEDALRIFADLSIRTPAYRDVNVRIAAIKKQQDLDQLFADAEAAYRAGRDADAAAKYEELKAINATYQGEVIASRLFDLYMRLGSGLIGGDRPRPEDVPAAAEYFSKALALQPRNAQAQLEQRLANLYLTAQTDYQAGNWERAVSEYKAIYSERPGYLGGQVIAPLYDAYIHTGDGYRGRQDCALAYEQYRQAAELPVTDRSLAVSRLDETRPCITPTPTPTVTSTPTAYRYAPPTGIPSATPPAPLASYHNQIIFLADKEELSGFWAMNPDGSNRRFLGPASKTLQDQYDALITRDQFSPDGRCQLYTTQGKSDKYPQIYIKCQGNLPGEVWIRQLTYLAGITYDPVWAPDGSRIAFVSQDHGSDDIYVIDPDGTNRWNYTPNVWEWDKHPSFSPDSQKIVFWSNREGTKQIYVMDANGRNLKKIFATTWDEYDPIWIK